MRKAQRPSAAQEPLCTDSLLKGISLSTLAWSESVEFALNRTLCLGGNAAMIRVMCQQNNISSLDPSCPTPPAELGSDLAYLLDRGRCMGISFALQAELHSADEGTDGAWAADIGTDRLGGRPFGETEWATWFDAWTAAETPWAAWASRHGIGVYSLGAELTSAQAQSRFARLVNTTRAAYPATAGELTYGADKESLDTVSVWPSLDAIGVDPYYEDLGSELNHPGWPVGVGVGVGVGLCVALALYAYLRTRETRPRQGEASALIAKPTGDEAEGGGGRAATPWTSWAVALLVGCVAGVGLGVPLGYTQGLYETNPSTETLRASWAAKAAPLWQTSRATRRPVLVHEIGFRSLDGTNNGPGAWQSLGAQNDGLQQRLWSTMLQEFCRHNASDFQGLFVLGLEDGRYNPTGYELTGKPALETIATAWGG